MKLFHQIPDQRPITALLDSIDQPAQLRALPEASLPRLADELRAFLLWSVGHTGGHFGAGLGVVELTIALHYVFDTPNDSLIWDVGHQAYPHKILTGRRQQMHSIRKKDGLAAFPSRFESPYDAFGVGHSSTSISAAQGMAIAHRLQGQPHQAVAIIGDGALTAGMAFEALNHAGHDQTDLLVILNDNNMSISENVGGLQKTLTEIFTSRTYSHLRENSMKLLGTLPPVLELARKAEEHMKGMVTPGTLFEELGVQYFGPIDGHDLPSLVRHLRRLKDRPGPKLLHLATLKGKGFVPAEQDPIRYHAISKIAPKGQVKVAGPKYSDIFGQWLCDMASKDSRLVGITPAMREGSGMVAFSEQFPERYFDVAIAEQHAVTLAAGMACQGLKPVVAIYSTFLQRAYDQVVHDVALQNLDVTFGIDRAGLVGEDGATHAGSFDYSFLRCLPNMVIMAPRDENQCRLMLSTAFDHPGPAAVRYPRGQGPGVIIEPGLELIELGKAECLRQGQEVVIFAFGSLVSAGLMAAEILDATLIDMRFIKPLDEAMIAQMAAEHSLVVTLEENVIAGGAGSAVQEVIVQLQLQVPSLLLGLPDQFIEQGQVSELLADVGLDPGGIVQRIEQRLKQIADDEEE